MAKTLSQIIDNLNCEVVISKTKYTIVPLLCECIKGVQKLFIQRYMYPLDNGCKVDKYRVSGNFWFKNPTDYYRSEIEPEFFALPVLLELDELELVLKANGYE